MGKSQEERSQGTSQEGTQQQEPGYESGKYAATGVGVRARCALWDELGSRHLVGKLGKKLRGGMLSGGLGGELVCSQHCCIDSLQPTAPMQSIHS